MQVQAKVSTIVPGCQALTFILYSPEILLQVTGVVPSPRADLTCFESDLDFVQEREKLLTF